MLKRVISIGSVVYMAFTFITEGERRLKELSKSIDGKAREERGCLFQLRSSLIASRCFTVCVMSVSVSDACIYACTSTTLLYKCTVLSVSSAHCSRTLSQIATVHPATTSSHESKSMPQQPAIVALSDNALPEFEQVN